MVTRESSGVFIVNYKYRIRRVNWDDKKERDEWFHAALIKGLHNNYIVIETINDEEEYSFYLGDDFIHSDMFIINERDLRILNWVRSEFPELLI